MKISHSLKNVPFRLVTKTLFFYFQGWFTSAGLEGGTGTTDLASCGRTQEHPVRRPSLESARNSRKIPPHRSQKIFQNPKSTHTQILVNKSLGKFTKSVAKSAKILTPKTQGQYICNVFQSTRQIQNIYLSKVWSVEISFLQNIRFKTKPEFHIVCCLHKVTNTYNLKDKRS